MSSNPPLLCPKCGEPMSPGEYIIVATAGPAEVGETENNEILQHEPKKGRCGRWSWRRQRVVDTPTQ